MDVEGIQVQELEEWGIHVHMLRLLGEIKDLIHDQFQFIHYYGGCNPSREALMLINGKEQSIQNRLQQYSAMYWHFCQAKLLNQAIYIMVRDKTQLDQKPFKMQFKEQAWSTEYDVEEICEKQQESESAIQYVRFKNRWWFVKFIKMTDLRTKYSTFYDVKVNLGEGTLSMQQQDYCKDIKIIDELNQWFKFIFFHPLNKKQTKYYQTEKQKELFHYIDETMQLVFESKACNKCNKIYALNHEGVLTTAFIKYSEPYCFKDSQILEIRHNVYHEQCLFI